MVFEMVLKRREIEANYFVTDLFRQNVREQMRVNVGDLLETRQPGQAEACHTLPDKADGLRGRTSENPQNG